MRGSRSRLQRNEVIRLHQQRTTRSQSYQLYGEDIYYIPTRTIRIPVDAAKVIANGTVRPEDADKIVPYIDIKLKGSWIMKSQLMVLDMLAQQRLGKACLFCDRVS
ncbi:MAG: hypothetical protein MZV63_31565 [Marinilabiliales bacterium]|nr:hypothetical protein [Marinilabiliales bacterium]